MHPKFRGLLLVLALGLAGARGAVAEEAPLTDEEAADLVLAAHAKGDAKGVQAVATLRTPGPWLTAWRLCARGEFAVAAAVAKAANDSESAALSAYVEKRKLRAEVDPADEAFVKAVALAKAGRHEEVLAVLPPGLATADGVLAARLATARGRSLAALGRDAEASAAYETGGRPAEDVGWLTRACELYLEGGRLAYLRGDRIAAERTWSRHLALSARVPDAELLALAQLNNGQLLQDAGALEEALALTAKAVATSRPLARVDLLISALDNEGVIARQLRLTSRARERHQEASERALALGEKSLAAQAQTNLGLVYTDLGDFGKARDALEAAVANAQAAGDGSIAGTALVNLGTVAVQLGQYDRAQANYEQAVAILEQIRDERGLSGALIGLAGVHLLEERFAEGEAFIRRGIEAAGRTGDRRLKSSATLNLIDFHSQRGRYEEALRLAEAGLKEVDPVADRDLALEFRKRIGLAQSLLDKHEPAVATLRDAVREIATLDMRDAELLMLEALAFAHLNAKQYVEAMSVARTAAEANAFETRGLSDEESAGVRHRRINSSAIGAIAAAKAGNAVQAAWFLESGRAGALLESLGGRGAVGSDLLPPALLEQERKARSAEASAATKRRAAARAKDAAALKATEAEVQAARAALMKAVEAIQRQEKGAAAVLYPKVRDLAALRALLGPADALVLYGMLVEASVAVVIEPKGERVVLLAMPKAIDEAAEVLREAATQGRGATELRAEVEALAKIVVDPLKLGAGVKRVVISPDGPLVYTPWNLLLGDREVALIPSGTTWAELREPAKTTPGDGVLALGDPVYGQAKRGAAVRAVFGEGDLAPLPATREEATKVGKVVLLGADATEARLRKTLAERKRWRAVHFACHGLVDPERPARSALALTPDEEDDGFLSSLEVTRLRVPADLVVLSACETGRGKVIRGEGLMGLSRAFMLAGAPRVLASLWKVDDRATLLLMERFYAHWKPGTPASRALAMAQKDVREYTTEVVDPEQSRVQGRDVLVKKQPYAAPAFWAGWVVWGLPD